MKQDPNHKAHPYSVTWEELPENIRDANRAVADHFEIKLRSVGCKIMQKNHGVEAKLDAGEIELLWNIKDGGLIEV